MRTLWILLSLVFVWAAVRYWGTGLGVLWLLAAGFSVFSASKRARSKGPDNRRAAPQATPTNRAVGERRQHLAESDLFEQIAGRFPIGQQEFSPDRNYLANAGYLGFEAMDSKKPTVSLINLKIRKLLYSINVPGADRVTVANDGTVLGQSWDPQGRAVCLDRSGHVRWTLDYMAPIVVCGLSAKGAWAFVSTGRSEIARDNWKLVLYDASSGKEVWRRDRPSADRKLCDVRFVGEELAAALPLLSDTQGVVAHKFASDGSLPNEFSEHVFELEVRSKGLATASLPRIRAALKSDPVQLTYTRNLLVQIKLDELTSEMQAKVHRAWGEFEEAQGNPEAALTAYKKALALNEKIGVKGRLARLAKQLK